MVARCAYAHTVLVCVCVCALRARVQYIYIIFIGLAFGMLGVELCVVRQKGSPWGAFWNRWFGSFDAPAAPAKAEAAAAATPAVATAAGSASDPVPATARHSVQPVPIEVVGKFEIASPMRR